MKRQDVIDFLNFRKKFTKAEWCDLIHAVITREDAKAAKIQLDDLDIEKILERFEREFTSPQSERKGKV